jgi:DNA-binding NtrC family response regulator
VIEPGHLPPELRPETDATRDSLGVMSLRSMEKRLIEETLRKLNGNRQRAAAELGINPSTLYRKMKNLAIETPETDGRFKQK